MLSGKDILQTRLEINLDLIKYNYELVKKYVSPAEVSVVVKGNGYGHGAIRIVKTLAEVGCKNFWVANLIEGIVLRNAGIKECINILGGLTYEQLEAVIDHGLIPFIPDVEKLKYLNHFAKKMNKIAKFHLKLDTGLGRLGIFPKNLDCFCETLDNCKNVQIIGVGSQLACSSKVHPLNELQYYRFKESVQYLKNRYGDKLKAHLSSSSPTLRFTQMNFDMVRIGNLIFGLSHFEKNPIPIKPVLAYKTVVVQVKDVPIGWNIGYGENYVCKPTRIALLPVGLVDGFNSVHGIRKNASVLIHGKKCPIISIATDQSMVNITAVNNKVKTGDEVVIIGYQGNQAITARELGLQADIKHTEILMKISSRVPRLYFLKNKLIDVCSIIK